MAAKVWVSAPHVLDGMYTEVHGCAMSLSTQHVRFHESREVRAPSTCCLCLRYIGTKRDAQIEGAVVRCSGGPCNEGHGIFALKAGHARQACFKPRLLVYPSFVSLGKLIEACFAWSLFQRYTRAMQQKLE